MSRCVIRRAESSTARSVGPRHRLEPAVHSELLEDVLHVVANGGGAQTELCGEGPCVGPVRHEPQDLDLALGQAARSFITGAAGPCGQRLYGLHQRLGRAVVSKHATRMAASIAGTGTTLRSIQMDCPIFVRAF